MTHKISILLLGSDLGNRKKNLTKAKELINSNIGEVFNESEIIETEPVGFTSDTLFLNQAIKVKTKLSPIKLLKAIKKIEKEMGRVYGKPKEGEKYTSRIIDIDILFFENIKYSSSVLEIPHHQVRTRDFVEILLNKLNLN